MASEPEAGLVRHRLLAQSCWPLEAVRDHVGELC